MSARCLYKVTCFPFFKHLSQVQNADVSICSQNPRLEQGTSMFTCLYYYVQCYMYVFCTMICFISSHLVICNILTIHVECYHCCNFLYLANTQMFFRHECSKAEHHPPSINFSVWQSFWELAAMWSFSFLLFVSLASASLT